MMHRPFRHAPFAALTLALTLEAASADPAAVESFDKTKPGGLPPGWSAGETGGGGPRWDVVADDSAPSAPNVLKQSGEAKFAWAVRDGRKAVDGFVEVKFKPLDGAVDQAGGVVWRFRDTDNYYVCRANALEGNVVAYKVVDGKRSSLAVKGRLFGYGVDVKVPARKWSTLRVDFAGTGFTVTFNGKKLFEAEDKTLTEAGRAGLWTKADSVTLFDDFHFEPSQNK